PTQVTSVIPLFVANSELRMSVWVCPTVANGLAVPAAAVATGSSAVSMTARGRARCLGNRLSGFIFASPSLRWLAAWLVRQQSNLNLPRTLAPLSKLDRHRDVPTVSAHLVFTLLAP